MRNGKLLLFAVSCLGCAGSALLMQQRYLASKQYFGADDTASFVFWLAPLSTAVGIVAVLLRALQLRSSLRHALSIVVGLLGGYFWTWLVANILGPWFRAFSFPVLYFFVTGAVVGLLVGSLYVTLFSQRTSV